MDMHVRTTGVKETLLARQYLWKHIYSSPDKYNILVTKLSEMLESVVNDIKIEVSTEEYSILVTSPVEFAGVTDVLRRVNNAFIQFLHTLYKENMIPEDIYYYSIHNAGQLCMITFLTNKGIRIGL